MSLWIFHKGDSRALQGTWFPSARDSYRALGQSLVIWEALDLGARRAKQAHLDSDGLVWLLAVEDTPHIVLRV